MEIHCSWTGTVLEPIHETKNVIDVDCIALHIMIQNHSYMCLCGKIFSFGVSQVVTPLKVLFPHHIHLSCLLYLSFYLRVTFLYELIFSFFVAPISNDQPHYNIEPQNGNYGGNHPAYEHFLFAQKSGYMLPSNQQLKSEYTVYL